MFGPCISCVRQLRHAPVELARTIPSSSSGCIAQWHLSHPRRSLHTSQHHRAQPLPRDEPYGGKGHRFFDVLGDPREDPWPAATTPYAHYHPPQRPSAPVPLNPPPQPQIQAARWTPLASEPPVKQRFEPEPWPEPAYDEDTSSALGSDEIDAILAEQGATPDVRVPPPSLIDFPPLPEEEVPADGETRFDWRAQPLSRTPKQIGDRWYPHADKARIAAPMEKLQRGEPYYEEIQRYKNQ